MRGVAIRGRFRDANAEIRRDRRATISRTARFSNFSFLPLFFSLLFHSVAHETRSLSAHIGRREYDSSGLIEDARERRFRNYEDRGQEKSLVTILLYDVFKAFYSRARKIALCRPITDGRSIDSPD